MKNPEKSRAHGIVKAAVERGEIVVPGSCERCGETGRRLEAHHHNGYSEEHVKDVVWLCHRCHGKAERELRAFNNAVDRALNTPWGQPYDPDVVEALHLDTNVHSLREV